jgi:hypothetical protein
MNGIRFRIYGSNTETYADIRFAKYGEDRKIGGVVMTMVFTDEEMKYLTFAKWRTIIADDCPPDIRASIEEKEAYIKAHNEKRERISKEREAIRAREEKTTNESDCERNTKQ